MQDPGGKASGIATRSVLSSGSLNWGRSLLQLVLLSSLGTPDIGSEVRGLASPVEGQVGSSSVLWKARLGRPGPSAGAVGTELLPPCQPACLFGASSPAVIWWHCLSWHLNSDMVVFFFPPLPISSVVKRDTTLTDAPKGTWPFSVDSDSSWNQCGAPESPAVGSVHLAAEYSAGRFWLQAPARAHFQGPCLSFHFAGVFLFYILKEGTCASVGSPEPEFAWTSVPLFFWTPCTVLLGREELVRAVPGPGWKMASRPLRASLNTST